MTSHGGAKPRVAVIGAGRMGRRHITAVRQLGLEVAGVCDLDEKALATARQEHQLSPEMLFRDARELLRRGRPECVIIATTAPSHCELGCLAVEAGARYVLCEKPMATSLLECDTLIDTFRRAGAHLAINHPTRFMETFTHVKNAVDSEAFGGLTSVTMVAGNIGVAMNGTHLFELFRHITGELPHEVTAWFSPGSFLNPRGPQYEDRAGAVRLTTVRGKRFYMEAGADQGHGFVSVYAGPYGRLIVDELTGDMRLSVRKASERSQPLTRYPCPADEKAWTIAAADVVAGSRAVLDALLHEKSFPSGEEGRLAVEVLVAAYVSHESGHAPVRLGETTLPRERKFPWP